ncbi:NRDE family protein [Actinocrinis sp.]|uniref:NRDE family protein n=1 Tax=Actinocrinis sp. TaxID=1920516 RepID=UPI002DDD7F1B|nr:NRDE family protein [Actinocrinis sp.]
MCTTVVSIDPQSPVPVLLVGVRDEFLDRPWLTPDRHWPEHPQLVGGQDLQARGTWLAVNAEAPRVACVLNAHGEAAEDSRRRTRGELPLRLAAEGGLGDLDPTGYDPFHLVGASAESARLWSWDGRTLTERALGAGLHVIVNSGLEGADGHDGLGTAQMQARIDHFRPLLRKAPRPEPREGTTQSAWEEWLPLATGAGLDPGDPRALVLRRTFDTRPWGTSSLSLVALTGSTVRYDFCANPADGDPVWSRIG